MSAKLVWREVFWPAPFPEADALALLIRLSTEPAVGTIVFEARAQAGTVRFLIGINARHTRALSRLIRNQLPGTRLTTPASPREDVTTAYRVTLAHPRLALSTERVEATARSVFAALHAAGKDQQLVLQVMLGERLRPELLPRDLPEPRHGWLYLLLGDPRPANPDTRARIKTRAGQHGFHAIIRIGSRADTPAAAQALARTVLGALRTAEAAGTRLQASPENVAKLNTTARPFRYPLRFAAGELIGLIGWPVGSLPLLGVPAEHPKKLAPPSWAKTDERVIAASDAPGTEIPLGIPASGAPFHSILTAPTGAGKSETMLRLIVADIVAGRGVLVVDPKYDLVMAVLSRIPAHRRGDVVIIDPTHPSPVGVNPLIDAAQNPELLAESLLAGMKSIWADSWGVRSEEVLGSALLTLTRTKGANLLWLPALLSDRAFRRKILKDIDDPFGVGDFWSRYDQLSPQAQAQLIGPTLTKLRQFLIRPGLRAVLGQSEPKFSLSDLLDKNRIVLVSLNKGTIGAESARLLGALITGMLWPLILRRSLLPQSKRPLVGVYIDEVHDYLALPGDLADAYAQARALGVAFTAAHQYRAQIPERMLAAFDANARNKIAWSMNAKDAAEIAKMAPALTAEDIMLLPRFHAYMTVMVNGESTGWMSARMLPAGPEISDAAELVAESAARYGVSAAETDKEVRRVLELDTPRPDDLGVDDDGPIGRRKR
ncbi:type IV secretory system conjugative DNA transfer family protein [Microbacterium sp.]|uniref:type IV secretory system conjugative DNA transfer family protein n=1 Tax=Microbacterium sp. TaxID=51671 RepID=UPI001AC51550|nr:type IV secretory system conjugative DNA transfer family protein [Microbacterium sp.]MBN9156927.1 type IV secretion system DNA-binding domain-containing protein [Microbacterium sp.]